jgi:serine/threonine protein kinase/WD40 repeat protein
MTDVPTSAEFLTLLRRYDLIPAAEVEKLARNSSDAVAFAQVLVEAGKLTPFQAQQLLRGRGGDLVLGPYVLLRRLGCGGMGEVFQVRHRLMGRIDALKLIRADLLGRDAAVARFRQEITAAAKLRHPNIILTYSADQTPRGLWLAMEFCDGHDLGRAVANGGPLPINLACDYAIQAATGLQHLVEHGLVHRDIKPTNLLLADATVKILDFGLARLRPKEEFTRLTPSGAMMGSPDFVAPEQARDAAGVDIRSDIYSLGCTLYFLLTGQVPFPGSTGWEKVLKHMSGTAILVEHLRPDVPASLGNIVRKMMMRDPAKRYQTPAEVAEALQPFRNSAYDHAQPDPVASTTEFAPSFVGVLPPQPPALTPPAPAVPLEDSLPPALALAAEPTETTCSAATPRVNSKSARLRRRWFVIGGLTAVIVSTAIVATRFSSKTPQRAEQDHNAGDSLREPPATFEEVIATGDNSLDSLPINRIAFHPTDPNLLAISRGRGGKPGVGGVELWELKTKKRRVLAGGDKHPPVCAIAFSPNGKFFAYGDGSLDAAVPGAKITVLETQTGQIQQFTTDSDGVLALTFHFRFSRYLAAGTRVPQGKEHSGSEIWDGGEEWTEEPKPLLRDVKLPGHAPVTALAFNPKKTFGFASAGRDGAVQEWFVNVTTPNPHLDGRLAFRDGGRIGPISDLAWSHGGQWVVGVTNLFGVPNPPDALRPQVLLWETRDRPLANAILHSGPPNADNFSSVVFLHDSQKRVTGVVTGDAGGKIRVWNVPNLTERKLNLKPFKSWVHALAVSPDGKILAAAGEVVGKGWRVVLIPTADLG